MTLVKKTVILTKNGAKGYITVVRVGSSSGIKAIIDYAGTELVMGLKIGAFPLIIKKINAAKSEFELPADIDFTGNDDISCLVMEGQRIYAEGGARGRIQLQDIMRFMDNENQSNINQKSKEVSHEKDKGVFQQIDERDKEVLQKDSSAVQTPTSAGESRREEIAPSGIVEIHKEKTKMESRIEQAKTKEIPKAEMPKGTPKTQIKEVPMTEKPIDASQTDRAKDSPKAETVKEEPKVERASDKKESGSRLEDKKETTYEKLESKESVKEKTETSKSFVDGLLKDGAKSAPKDVKSFYYSVKDKLDELFVMYPREKMLENIIPSSKWVRINYDKDDYYVAGVLVDDDGKVTHIAYGVPGFEGKSPPKETECICDWLPLKDMDKFEGYWLIFQSADTGEILPKD